MRTSYLTIPFSTALLTLATGVAGAATTWSAAATVSTGATALTAPAVATNVSGRVAASWTDNGQVMVSIRDGVANWPAAVPMLQAPAAVATNSDVVVAPNGDVLVSWLEGPAANQQLKTAAYTAGGWTAPLTLSTGAARQSQLAIDGNGNVTAAWMETNTTAGSCAIRAVTATSAGDFGASSLLSTDCRNVLDLAVNSRGDALVAWSNRMTIYGGSSVIASQRSGNAGAWSLPVIVGAPTYRSHDAHVALADNGKAVAVWSDAYGPQYARRAANGVWGVAGAVDPAGSVSYTGITDVVMDATGNATAILGTFDMTFTMQSLVARRLAGNSYAWSKPVRVTAVNSFIDRLDVASDSSGSIVVGWLDTNTNAISGNFIGAGVSTYANGAWSRKVFASGYQSIAVGIAGGSATAVWTAGSIPATLKAATAVVP